MSGRVRRSARASCRTTWRGCARGSPTRSSTSQGRSCPGSRSRIPSSIRSRRIWSRSSDLGTALGPAARRRTRRVAPHRRPQGDRCPLHRDGRRFLCPRWPRGAAPAGAACDARSAARRSLDLRPGVHGPRRYDDPARDRSAPRRLRQLPRAADDRRARRRVSAPTRALFLAIARRRHRLVFQLPGGRRAGHRLVLIRAARRALVRAGSRGRLLHPRTRGERRGHDRRGDQPHRDHPPHALPGDGDLARAALRVDDARHERAHPRRVSRAHRCARHALRRSAARRSLLRSRRRRTGGAVASPLLGLSPPRGLHHGATPPGGDPRGHPRLQPKAHLRYVLFGGTMLGVFAGAYYWFPKMTGRLLDEGLGKLHFWTTFVGFNLTFLPQHWLGAVGMPRRVFTYAASTGWGPLNLVSTIGAAILAVAMVIFVVNLVRSLRSGEIAGDDPWDAFTLEWATSSPPPPENFAATPAVTGRRPLRDRKHPQLREPS